ncbi:glucose-1-phosphate cytidylyltransferase [Gammaproteobacteria bacterium]|nr:glucose-1-phosphate cytidylyltransferase [Gammaproteobacteria bacterium]
MKAVILAGGLGTRLSEETATKPKPMIEIGGKPILWHILKIYSAHGITDFIICCGYKGYVIKEYFSNYFLHMSDITLDIKNNKMTVLNRGAEDWSITLVDTGDASMTGGRLLRVKDYLSEDDCFCFTYGDGLSDIDITALIEFHKGHGKDATLTATYPSGRFGALELESNVVKSFKEKPRGDGSLINGGFFVLNPSVIDLIKDDNTVWEQDPLMALAEKKQLMAYKHSGFWQPMDTLRDKVYLERLWEAGNAPWKSW